MPGFNLSYQNRFKKKCRKQKRDQSGRGSNRPALKKRNQLKKKSKLQRKRKRE